MRRLLAILGLMAVFAAAGCGGSNSAATVHGTAFSGGPVGGGTKLPPPPAPPTLRR